MWTKETVIKASRYSMILISVYSIIPYPADSIGILKIIDNVTIWWLLNALMLFTFYRARTLFFDFSDSKIFIYVKIYLLWNVMQILRGTLVAESYWDWKGLVSTSMGLLIPIVAYASSNIRFLQYNLQYYIKYSLPLFCLILVLVSPNAFGLYLVPISFLLFFLPALRSKWKIYLGVFTLVVLLADFGARSSIIKFTIPLLLLVVFYFKSFFTVRILELLRKVLFIIPIVLFTLGVLGIFNVFKIDDYINVDLSEVKKDKNGEITTENLKSDTRTLLYVEVLQTAAKFDTWIFGRSPARGNETEIFSDIAEITGNNERLGNEVAILNIFTWTGVIGVVLYLLVFYKASYLAVNNSNNTYSKMIGIFVAFRWIYAWVEDINNFSLTTYFLWVIIGFCLSSKFRKLTNVEIKIWIQGIFEKKYRRHFMSMRN
jgi:hypothetical protein